MPELTPTKLFLKDIDALVLNQPVQRNILKALAFLQENPFHPGLHLERIINDPTAWSIRVDRRYRISIDPKAHQSSGAPNWNRGVILLRILDHDDLYKKPR
jgi:mRNA-degrading endonuclease RelE of RelBE toxin-antitoxin system